MTGGTDGFLVVLRRRFDDQPLGLFATRDDAVRFAARVRPTGTHDGPVPPAGCTGSAEHNTLGVESFAIGVLVVEFRGGEPGEPEVAASFMPTKRKATP